MPEEETTELVVQPTKQPTRKVRFAGIAALALVVVTYLVSAVAGGESLVSEQAALDALKSLGATLVPLITAWVTKSAVSEAGE
jgi:hypothetical protein